MQNRLSIDSFSSLYIKPAIDSIARKMRLRYLRRKSIYARTREERRYYRKTYRFERMMWATNDRLLKEAQPMPTDAEIAERLKAVLPLLNL